MENAPYNYNYKRLDNSVQFHNLVFNEETGVSAVHNTSALIVIFTFVYLTMACLYHFLNGSDMDIIAL